MATVVLSTVASAEVPSEGIQDALQTVLTGGTYVTIVYNDGANTYTFDLSTEALMDFLSTFLVNGTNTTVVYNDGSNTLQINAASPGSITSLTTSTARTATSDGSGTGTIADGTDFVPVTSADANNIIILPTPTPKTTVALHVAATGYELRSSSPTTVGINGGTGAAAESAIPANTTTICFCPIATNWICSNTTSAGVTTVTEVAAP